MTASRPAAAVATGLEAATVSSSRVPTGKPRAGWHYARPVQSQWLSSRPELLRADSSPVPTQAQVGLSAAGATGPKEEPASVLH